MLILSDGTKKGIVPIESALKTAREDSMDLVQVSAESNGVTVCKILDYNKHIFERKNTTSKVKTKKHSTKEIKFRPSTDIGDYQIKLKKIKSFILDGDKTKISVRFRVERFLIVIWALNLLNRLRGELKDIAQVEQEPSLEGRQLIMILSPLKRKR